MTGSVKMLGMLGLLMMLWACGKPEGTQLRPTVPQSAQSGATATPTLDPKYIKQTAIAVQVLEAQTALAGTPAPTKDRYTAVPTIWPPATPAFYNATPMAGGGYIMDYQNINPTTHFMIGNRWTIQTSIDTMIIVNAGGYWQSDHQPGLTQGGIFVSLVRLGMYNTTVITKTFYPTPFKVGKAKVLDALVTPTSMHVLIQTENHTTWWFDVTNRRWLTPVTLVVADPERLSEVDSTIQAHLQSHDYLPMLKADTSITSTAVLTSHVLLISSSVDPTVVQSHFKDSTMPIVVWNPAAYEHLNLVSSDKERGTVANDSITIAQPTHQLTGGLSGTVQLFKINQMGGTLLPTMPYGMPPTTAIRIAYPAVPARPDPNSFSYFAYEQGAVMADNFVAPAKRVALPWAEDGIPTTQGWQLFDAALMWASTP